jgi:hypothetical protein
MATTIDLHPWSQGKDALGYHQNGGGNGTGKSSPHEHVVGVGPSDDVGQVGGGTGAQILPAGIEKAYDDREDDHHDRDDAVKPARLLHRCRDHLGHLAIDQGGRADTQHFTGFPRPFFGSEHRTIVSPGVGDEENEHDTEDRIETVGNRV